MMLPPSLYRKEVATKELTLTDLKALCPAMFAEHPHDSRSSRYLYIPTAELIQGLQESGFAVIHAMQSKPRLEDREGFTKHIIFLLQRSAIGVVQEEYRGAAILNSHDGSSSYQLLQFVYRLVCKNGLMRGEIENTLRIPHKSSALPKVIDATYKIIEEGEETMKVIETMKQIGLSRDKQLLLAELAMSARFDVNPQDKDAMALIPYRPEQFLRPHRMDDMNKNDLNTVFNVVQENIIRPNGHVSYHDNTRERKKHTLKNINGIDQNVKLNTMLFALAEGMAKLS